MGRRVAAGGVSRTVNGKILPYRDVRSCLQKAGKPVFYLWDLILSTQSALVVGSVNLFRDALRHRFIVMCGVPSLMCRGSNPLRLNCGSVLAFCKEMRFNKRSFLPILMLFCFKRQQLLASFGYGAGVIMGGEIFTGHSVLLLAHS